MHWATCHCRNKHCERCGQMGSTSAWQPQAVIEVKCDFDVRLANMWWLPELAQPRPGFARI